MSTEAEAHLCGAISLNWLSSGSPGVPAVRADECRLSGALSPPALVLPSSTLGESDYSRTFPSTAEAAAAHRDFTFSGRFLTYNYGTLVLKVPKTET